MSFCNSVMVSRFFNKDVPEAVGEIQELRKTIEKLCDVLDPDNFEDRLVPRYALEQALKEGASFKANCGEDFVVVTKRR